MLNFESIKIISHVKHQSFGTMSNKTAKLSKT